MSLRTNNRIVCDRVRAHVLDHYEERGAQGVAEDMRAIARGSYGMEAARDLVRGGNFDISYYDQRHTLRGILEQTEAEADKYTDEQVFRCYVELLAREIVKIHDDYMYSPALPLEEEA